MPLLLRQRREIPPCLNFMLQRDQSIQMQVNSWKAVKRIIRVGYEGLSIYEKINGEEGTSSPPVPGEQLRNPQEEVSRFLRNYKGSLLGHHVQECAGLLLQQLNHNSTLTLRILLDPSHKPDGSNVFLGIRICLWSKIHHVLCTSYPCKLRIKVIFVVKPQHLDQCLSLATESTRFYDWIANDSWSIEVSSAGLDSATDLPLGLPSFALPRRNSIDH